jgi:hypothetical protein
MCWYCRSRLGLDPLGTVSRLSSSNLDRKRVLSAAPTPVTPVDTPGRPVGGLLWPLAGS